MFVRKGQSIELGVRALTTMLYEKLSTPLQGQVRAEERKGFFARKAVLCDLPTQSLETNNRILLAHRLLKNDGFRVSREPV